MTGDVDHRRSAQPNAGVLSHADNPSATTPEASLRSARLTGDGLVLAVDIGGTKLAACLAGPEGLVGDPVTTPTPHGDGETVWNALAGLIDTVLRGRTVSGVGIGSAGPLSVADGTISPVNIPGWRGFPLVERVSGRVPGAIVRLAGDGSCAAAGEHWLGAGRGLDDLLVLVVSTGVGGGLIQHGRLVHGVTGNAGHVGHMVVDVDGDPCPCGSVGCVESAASGPSMVSWALRQGWEHPEPSGVALAAAARRGDPVALAAFERGGRALAAGIVSAAALADVERAVIGGGIGRAADVLFPPLQAHLGRYAQLTFLRRLTVVPAGLGTSAGLAGAAALVLHPDRYAP